MQSKRKIWKLDENVIARIAAGEVVHRPSSAVKELLENSLDAGAKSIHIQLKDGGMKRLEIKDDGCGISKDDLPAVCERHTTSKLKKWEDLKSINTFGFRGEALASISHVSHVTITSQTSDQPVAFKMEYADGKPKDPKPKPVAGLKGTHLIIEDLFYNTPLRKKTIKNPNDEYNRVVDVVSLYAINNASVSFTVKKLGESIAQVSTRLNSTPTDNIRALFGESVANVLLPVSVESTTLGFSMTGLASKSTFDYDNTHLVLFYQ